MKRYDIGIEDLGGLTAPRLDIAEQEDGEWVKWNCHLAKVDSIWNCHLAKVDSIWNCHLAKVALIKARFEATICDLAAITSMTYEGNADKLRSELSMSEREELHNRIVRCRQKLANLILENHDIKGEVAALKADNAEKRASMKTNAMRPDGNGGWEHDPNVL